MQTSVWKSSKTLQLTRKYIEKHPFLCQQQNVLHSISSGKNNDNRNTHTNDRTNELCLYDIRPIMQICKNEKRSNEERKKQNKTNRTRYKQIKRNVHVYSNVTIFYLWYIHNFISSQLTLLFYLIHYSLSIFSISLFFLTNFSCHKNLELKNKTYKKCEEAGKKNKKQIWVRSHTKIDNTDNGCFLHSMNNKAIMYCLSIKC